MSQLVRSTSLAILAVALWGCASAADAGTDATDAVTEDVQPAPTCDNGVKDPGESDVDSGGACAPCTLGRSCDAHGDCVSATCLDGVCEAPSCGDDVKNQGETDVDCGGPECGACEVGGACSGDGDCASGDCWQGVCVSCADGVMNHTETDVDCGGGCPACALGQGCTAPGDCASGACEGEMCCTPNACGQCSTSDEVCDGVDNDCNGQTDEGLGDAQAPACELHVGVCAGAKATCAGADGWVCDAAIYAANDGRYEPVEATCDGVDNDCDGQTDEGVANACGDCGPAPLELCNGLDDDCDGATDELPECAVCASPNPIRIGDDAVTTGGPHSIARAGGRIWLAYSSARTIKLAELVDGGVAQTLTVGDLDGTPGGTPQLQASGDTLQLAWRSDATSYTFAQLDAAGASLKTLDWSCQAATNNLYAPYVAGGADALTVYYHDDLPGTDGWFLGRYDWAAESWVTTASTWYTPYTGLPSPELVSLSTGEVVQLYPGDTLEARSSGDGFATATSVLDGSYRTISAAVDGDDTVHVAVSGYSGFRYLVRSSAGTWAQPVVLNGMSSVAMAVTPAGAPVAVGEEGGVGLAVYEKHSQGWVRAAELGGAAGGQGNPAIAADPFGRYHVAVDRTGYSGDLQGLYYVVLCPDLSQ